MDYQDIEYLLILSSDAKVYMMFKYLGILFRLKSCLSMFSICKRIWKINQTSINKLNKLVESRD